MLNYSFIGDSNFRDLLTTKKAEIEDELGIAISFEFASSVASVKTLIGSPDFGPDVVFVGCPTNEIGLKSKNNTKSREGIIEGVITDLLNTIIDQANKKDSISYVICQPFLRLDPPWLEAKLPFYKSFLKTTHANTTNGNIHIGGEIDIQANDLKADRVHLNQEGMDKLFSVLVADLKTAKEDVEGLRSNVDMDDAPLSSLPRSSKRTPVRRKRTHDLESSEEEGKTVKKKNTLERCQA